MCWGKSTYLSALASGICLVNFVNFQGEHHQFHGFQWFPSPPWCPPQIFKASWFSLALSALCSGHTTDKSVLDLSRKVASFITGTSPSKGYSYVSLLVSVGIWGGFTITYILLASVQIHLRERYSVKHLEIFTSALVLIKTGLAEFPDGSVVKTELPRQGSWGSIPCPGTKIPHSMCCGQKKKKKKKNKQPNPQETGLKDIKNPQETRLGDMA